MRILILSTNRKKNSYLDICTKDLMGLVTWTIPKIEVLGDMIDPAPWGTTYQWNYHNGGVAWAMQQLSELTNNHGIINGL